MNKQVAHLKELIEPLRQEIINHKVYSAIRNIDDLKVFMEFHVYAVWDFMSLLKTLQNNLTCTTVPWYPLGSPETRFFINEIVVGEESDVDLNGTRKSHFELYLDAMKQCGANTSQIETFIRSLKDSGDFKWAYEQSKTPKEAAEFVNFTFDIINSQKVYLQAAIFTFGREDLIPSMFISIVEDIHKKFPTSISNFKYYLERHIEIDGDHHSHLALNMTSNLCNENQQFWEEVQHASIESLKKRIALWDGAYFKIMEM